MKVSLIFTEGDQWITVQSIPNTDLLDGLHRLKTKENTIFHYYFKSLCSDVIISHL